MIFKAIVHVMYVFVYYCTFKNDKHLNEYKLSYFRSALWVWTVWFVEWLMNSHYKYASVTTVTVRNLDIVYFSRKFVAFK